MATYTVKDSGNSDTGLAFSEAVQRIAEWYEDCDQWATGEGDDAIHDAIAEAIDSIKQPESGNANNLQGYADAICEAVARACGNKDFAGHGNYFVSAASRGGFFLTIEEETEEPEEEPIEIEVTFHDANPNANSGSQFSSLAIEVESWGKATEAVQAELLSQASGLAADMGYSVGDTIWATWEDEGGCYQELRHTLTAIDLGVSE